MNFDDNSLYNIKSSVDGKRYSLFELATWKNGLAFKKINFCETGVPVIKIAELNNGIGGTTAYTQQIFSEDVHLCKGDLLFSWSGNPQTSIDIFRFNLDEGWLNQHIFKVTPDEKTVDRDYFYFLMKNLKPHFTQIATNKQTTGLGHVTIADIKRMSVVIPSLDVQREIVSFIKPIDDKIKLNNEINNNLEEQLSALFVNMFGHSIDSLDNSDIKLGDLIESVDNRGKTPPLSDEPTDYPIIDVRALSGNSRIIDYTNCTKYVSKETYNNWFRSGHPKEYDILISTVGSLAEMKIFLGTIGCIAQNVVGFRTKGISPLYLYQYLNYIKNDLVAYNIGSVQPSIKVTHIIKHSIYVASKEDIEIFDSIARNITKKIFANCQENEALKQIRDTLLPKLMSGELDVSNIKI